MPSQFANHLAKWSNCQLCPLSTQRTRMVFARGDVPCEVLYLGEAPGQSEDVLGLPFMGPAGKLLDDINGQAMREYEASRGVGSPTVGFVNIVCCFPRVAKQTKVHEPATSEIKACSPRLKEFVDICKPKLVVLVGKLAAKWAHLSIDMADPSIKFVEIAHPASILRLPPQNIGLAMQKCVVTISDALEEPF